ncbi:MAG: YafY family transcriptional regulator [Sneathiella sp.]|nr:YafY family transcriptional regulator [Sneathiella sp.]
MRLIRLFKILDYLRTVRQPVSAESLGERFDVSVRTIYRDMAALQDLGAPIRGESGIGYQIEAGFFMPPLHLDADEMDALALGMRLVVAKSDTILSHAAKSVSAKVSAVLPEDMKGPFLNTPFRAYSKAHKNAPLEADIIRDVRLAMRVKEKLDFTYLSLKDEISQRIVHPLGISNFDDAWLLTAWCEKQQDFRNFRLDRIMSVTLTGKNFHPTPGRTFEDYIKTI